MSSQYFYSTSSSTAKNIDVAYCIWSSHGTDRHFAHPFEWVDHEIANFAVYDKSMKCVIATVQTDDGLYRVQMATQCDSGFVTDNLRDAAQSAGLQDAYMTRMGWG
jgi:hypothetical protein